MQYKASKPVIAPITEDSASGEPVYGSGEIIGKLMTVNASPENEEVKVYADDGLAESVSAFKSAKIDLGTNIIKKKAGVIMFGFEYNEESQTEIYRESDDGKYCGFGYIYAEKADGKDKYYFDWYFKVKFALPSKSYTTKGESVAFNTPTISGTAYSAANGKWRETLGFDTAAEANAELMKRANISTVTATKAKTN